MKRAREMAMVLHSIGNIMMKILLLMRIKAIIRRKVAPIRRIPTDSKAMTGAATDRMAAGQTTLGASGQETVRITR